MAPNNASFQSPVRSKTVLARPRPEVDQKIRDRIQQGGEMQKRPKQNVADSIQFAVDVQKWRSFNLDLLESAFTDKSLRDEYYRTARDSYVDTSENIIPVM